jgi:hypothetical protein
MATQAEIARQNIPPGYVELNDGDMILGSHLYYDNGWERHTDCLHDIYERPKNDLGFCVTIRPEGF